MLDRGTAVDNQFKECVRQGNFPSAQSVLMPQEVNLERDTFLDLFDSQLLSRHLDLQARKLKEQNHGFYTIGSSGHEGNAVLGHVFRYTDMAFLHYRSGAFFMQRAKQLPQIDAVKEILLSLTASSQDPISAGRHKVFGSVPLFIPPQTSTIASHLPKALGAAFSITRAKELNITSYLPSDSVILCSFGDASFNHASAQTALNAAQWMARQNYPLPLVFICEDNGIGISVPTPHDWIKSRMEVSALHYIAANGLHLPDLYRAAKEAEYYARHKKQPVFLHVKCARLLGHAGSDIESQYLSQRAIEATEFNDPLLHSARIILQQGWLTASQILQRYEAVAKQVEIQAQEAILTPKLSSAEEVMASICPSVPLTKPVRPAYSLLQESQRQALLGEQYTQVQTNNKRNLCQQINLALMDLMAQHPNIVLFGEDIGKKGGVYRVTAGLQQVFGQRRVFDTLLDETTILGSAIGLAHNGFLPIPEIQFLAYLHNAEDQLRGEAATLSFFSNGQYSNPMVIRIAGLAYQKGFGGHFHNDNSIAVLRDIPGIIVACPSNGLDAAKMLRTCVALAQEQGRVVIFLEPIALYMTKDLHQPGDQEWLFPYSAPQEQISLGEIGIYGESKEIVIITFANGYYLSRQAEQILRQDYKIKLKIIDLRWLVPLPKEAILAAVKGIANILIVDEGRQSGSISEALFTMLMEELEPLPCIQRITGEDCFIPLGGAWHYILPSKEAIIDKVLTLLNMKLTKEPQRGRLSISG